MKVVDSETNINEIAADVLARTLWGEARGEGANGMLAVACVILNRVALAAAMPGGKYWWGNNIVHVCQKPYQFSCWNRCDPNFQKLQAVNETDPDFEVALRIARLAVSGKLQDEVNGATHYCAAGTNPYWAKSEMPVCTVGHHIFYNMKP